MIKIMLLMTLLPNANGDIVIYSKDEKKVILHHCSESIGGPGLIKKRVHKDGTIDYIYGVNCQVI